MIGIPDDLENALVANPVFVGKIATQDLLTYDSKEAPKCFAMITTEHLQRGDERLSTTSLMAAEAAKVIVSNANLSSTYPYTSIHRHFVLRQMGEQCRWLDER